MQVSVIIINYNTKDMTMDCINSVFEKTRDVEFEIILVDNGSVDGSKELFEKDERITYYYLNENLGFGKANNYGIERASGEYIFCLNSDTLLINNAIYLFYDFAKDKDDIGAVGGMLVDKEGKRNFSYGEFPSCLNLLKDLYHIYRKKIFSKNAGSPNEKKPNTKGKENNSFFSVDYVCGADMFIKTELLKKYGAFDPDFFMYHEEMELQYRLSEKGYGSAIYAAPKLIHFDGSSSKNIEVNVKKYKWRLTSLFLYFKKTLGSLQYFLFRSAYAILGFPLFLKNKIGVNILYAKV